MNRTTRSNSVSDGDVLTKSGFEAIMARLEKKIDSQKNDFNDTVDRAIEKLTANFDKSIGYTNRRVNKIEATLDDNDRISRLKEIVINGIPVVANENLLQIFEKIAVVIGFNRQCCYIVDIIFRLGKSKTSARPSQINFAPILVRFTTQLLKNEFLQLYFKHRNVTLVHIGFNDCEDRVYVNHNLTKSTSILHKAALKLKKSGKILNIRIKSGFVFVIWHGTTTPVRITTLNELQIDNSPNLETHSAI